MHCAPAWSPGAQRAQARWQPFSHPFSQIAATHSVIGQSIAIPRGQKVAARRRTPQRWVRAQVRLEGVARGRVRGWRGDGAQGVPTGQHTRRSARRFFWWEYRAARTHARSGSLIDLALGLITSCGDRSFGVGRRSLCLARRRQWGSNGRRRKHRATRAPPPLSWHGLRPAGDRHPARGTRAATDGLLAAA